MSIISNITAAPNRVEMLINYLKSTNKQYTKLDLDVLFSPPSGKQNEEAKGSTFKEVYSVVESLGLINIVDDFVKLDLSNKKLSTFEIIKSAIFKKDFIESDNIVFAISWLQTQNSIKDLNWSDDIRNIVNRDLNNQYDELDLKGNLRWQHFGYWCIYLGFATQVYIGEKNYICPDPTKAISNELKIVFQENKELTINEFLVSLSNILPVLEQGYIRRKINESIREGLQLPENNLSTATSLALLRLEDRGIIKLIHKADADSLTIQNGDKNNIISHISYLGK